MDCLLYWFHWFRLVLCPIFQAHPLILPKGRLSRGESEETYGITQHWFEMLESVINATRQHPRAHLSQILRFRCPTASKMGMLCWVRKVTLTALFSDIFASSWIGRGILDCQSYREDVASPSGRTFSLLENEQSAKSQAVALLNLPTGLAAPVISKIFFRSFFWLTTSSSSTFPGISSSFCTP